MTNLRDLAGGTPLSSVGDVTLSALVVAAADDVALVDGQPTSNDPYPTDGRVAVDTTTDTAYIGDGSAWQDVQATVGLDGQLRPARYSQGNLPSSPPDGSVFHDTSRGLPAWYDTDHYEWPSFVDDVLTSGQTVANTTTRTEVWNPDINAGSLIKGRIYQIDLMGKFSTANTSDQFEVLVDIGGTDVSSLQNAQANATDAPWAIEVTYTVREHGENGVIQPHTKGIFDGEPKDEHHSTVSIDTTTPTNLSVDLKWSAADPDNSATLGQAHLKQMG